MVESTDGIQNAIERIAVDIMAVTPEDLSGLGRVYSGLGQIADELPETRPAQRLTAALLAAVERAILEGKGGDRDSLDILARGIDTLQQLQQAHEKGEEEGVDEGVLAEIARLSGREVTMAVDGAVEEEPAATAPEEEEEETGWAEAGSEGDVELADDAFDAELVQDFVLEAEEHLNNGENALLGLEQNAEDEDALNTAFRAFHGIKGSAGFVQQQEIILVAHAAEDLLAAVRKGDLRIGAAILDAALEGIDLLKGLVGRVQAQVEGRPAGEVGDIAPLLTRIGELAARKEETAAPSPGELDLLPADGEEEFPEEEEYPDEEIERVTGAPSGAAPAGGNGEPAPLPSVGPPEALLAEEGDSAAEVDAGPDISCEAPPEVAQTVPASKTAGETRLEQHFVRVGTDKLDHLMNLVGELVISQTQVSQNPEILESENQKLVRDIVQLMKTSREIQETAMSMRMVPIQSVFERMRRVARDAAHQCGKRVSLRLAGEETELDKNVVEELVDPLTHMVRNAVDHGVESPEERRAAGKPETGDVSLEAYHKGGNVVIELRDDGRGLDPERIRRKAVAQGLLAPDAECPPEEIYPFIFQPGISTVDQVSAVSGRGVGMDVVRTTIEKFRGRVGMQSEPGEGAIFTIQLPLTLAIIDGMIIGVGGQRYILPLGAIVRMLHPGREEIFSVMGQGETIKLQGKILPLVRLNRKFGTNGNSTHPDVELVVVIEADNRCCGLVVDELLDMQQVVIKPLEKGLHRGNFVSGCAVLGDGRVGLILDPGGLVSYATARQENPVTLSAAS